MPVSGSLTFPLGGTGTAVTLGDLESMVRQQGDYNSSLTFTQEYIQHKIQAGWRELYELMDSVNEGWWDTEGSVSTVAAQRYIALPTDCWRVRGVDILDGSSYVELDQVIIGERNRWGTATAKPQAYRLSARGIELFPTPNAVYTLRVTYSPICPILDVTTPTEMYGWHEFVVEAALLKLYEREERDISEVWKKLYDPQDGLKAQITRAANKRKQQGPEYLLLREGGGTYEEPY